jgi:very-short-patch-repair endonuclease
VDDSLHLDRNSSGPGGESAVDHLIAALAWRHYGVVAREQLRHLGLSDDAIDYRVAIGRLLLIHQGVYAVGHDRLAPEGRWLAAVWAGGDEAVLSHRSAARLWGLLPWEGRIEVTTPRNRRKRADIHYVRSPVESLERTEHRAIPVTTVARTLFDLGAVDSARVPKALEQADVIRLLDVRELQRLVDEHPRRPGTRAIRAALASASAWRGVTRSELEQRFRACVEQAELPLPELNRRVDLGPLVIEADAVWPEARLIVELDGYAYHRTAAAFERDRARDRAATAAGWRVIRITWRQLADDPKAVIRDLRRALSPPRPQ